MLESYDVEFSAAEAIVALLDRRYHYEFLRDDSYFLAMILISFGSRRNLMIQEWTMKPMRSASWRPTLF